MSMYIPEFKEELSAEAKMLVIEEDGKVYRTGMPSGGNGNTYDAIIKYDNQARKEEVLHGSYDAIGAKIQAGEYVNVLVYAINGQYNMHYGIVKGLMFDDDESYSIRVTCDIPGLQIENESFFIY